MGREGKEEKGTEPGIQGCERMWVRREMGMEVGIRVGTIGADMDEAEMDMVGLKGGDEGGNGNGNRDADGMGLGVRNEAERDQG